MVGGFISCEVAPLCPEWMPQQASGSGENLQYSNRSGGVAGHLQNLAGRSIPVS